MKKNDNLSVEIIRYNIPQEKAQSFEKTYSNAARYLQSSPYCVGYNILKGEDEPNHYIVTIYWSSKEDHLNGFRKSDQFGSFFNLVKPFFNAIEEMKHYIETPMTWTKDYQKNE